MGTKRNENGLFLSTQSTGLLWCAHANGYPVLPVKPGSKRPAVAGWEQYNEKPPSADTCRQWSNQFPGHSIGIASGTLQGFIGIDCDVLDVELSRECWKALVEVLDGRKPPTRIGLHPKWLALVGTGGARIASRKPHPFEIFGHNGQFVAFGIHPKTQKPYNWVQGSPIDTPISELPVITETGINHWLMKCAKIVGKEPIPASQTQKPTLPGTTSNLRTELSKERQGLRGKEYGRKIMEQLDRLGPNNKSDILISVVSSLIFRGFSDSNIIAICKKPYLDKWEGYEEHGIEFLTKMLYRTRQNFPKWSDQNG